MILFGLSIAREHELSPVGCGEMHVDHLDSGKFLKHGPWCESWSKRTQPALEGHLKAIGDERDEDVCLDASVFVVVNGPPVST